MQIEVKQGARGRRKRVIEIVFHFIGGEELTSVFDKGRRREHTA
jgi:hypothetical protein